MAKSPPKSGSPSRTGSPSKTGSPAESVSKGLADRFEFVRLLGRGANGRVFLLEDRNVGGPNQRRAGKVVPPSQRARISLEFSILSRIAHPHVARVQELLSITRSTGAPFHLRAGELVLVEEFAGDRNAREALRECTDDPQARLSRACLIGLGAARGLSAMHAQGVIHGDVKPDNIVVDDAGTPRWVDLGLARVFGPLHRLDNRPRGEVGGGSLGFLAPEGFSGERTVKTDLFAFGASLCALFGGYDPAGEPATDVTGWFHRSLKSPQWSSSLPSHVPPGVIQLIRELLRQDAEQRPWSAREVAGRLAAAAKSQGALDSAVGGGADDEPTPIERAMEVQSLPLIGHGPACDALENALEASNVVVVSGPPGSGRSRVIAEGVRRHRERAHKHAAQPPIYVRSFRAPPPDADGDNVGETLTGEPRATSHTIAHIDFDQPSTDSPSALESVVTEARQWIRAASLNGDIASVAIESTHSTEHADVQIELGPLDDPDWQELLARAMSGEVHDEVAERASRSTARLSGKLCSAVQSAWLREGTLARVFDLDVRLRTNPGAALSANAVAEFRRLGTPAWRLAGLLAAAGGRLKSSIVSRFVSSNNAPSTTDSAASAIQALIARGLAVHQEDGHSFELRPDTAASVREHLAPDEMEALGRQLDDCIEGDVFARGCVDAVLGRRSAARVNFLAALRELRKRGRVNEAAQAASLARWYMARLEPTTSNEEAAPSSSELLVAHADALRALGAYSEARALLYGRPEPSLRLLYGELSRLSGDRAEAHHACQSGLSPTHEAPRLMLVAQLELDEGAWQAAERTAAEAQHAAAEAQHAAAEALETPATHLGARMAQLDARAAQIISWARFSGGDAGTAREVAYRGLHAAQRHQLPAEEARLWSICGSASSRLGRGADAIREHAKSFELAERAGERHAASAFLVNLGLARLDAGSLGPAISALRDGARRLARLGRDADCARALYNLANAALWIGDDAMARSAHEQARPAIEASEDDVARAYSALLMAEASLRADERKQAATWTEDALLTAQTKALPLTEQCLVFAKCANLWSRLEHTERARSALSSAETSAERSAHLQDHHRAEILLASAQQAAKGAPSTAIDYTRKARACAARATIWELRLRAALAHAEQCTRAGKTQSAQDALGEARTLLDNASATLAPPARIRLRSVSAYHAAFSTLPTHPDKLAGHQNVAAESGTRWKRLVAIAKELSAEHRLGRLYERTTHAALEITGGERAFLVLRNDEGELRTFASLTPDGSAVSIRNPANSTGVISKELSWSIVARTIDETEAIATVDAAHDERLEGAASIHALELRSVLSVPVRAQRTTLGALYLDDRLRPAAFPLEDRLLVSELADFAGAAIFAAQRLRSERRGAIRAGRERKQLVAQVEQQALELDSLRRDRDEEIPGVIAGSQAMQDVLRLAMRIAASDASVLLSGESGTGKELVAAAIHQRSLRRAGPFVAENCGAIPEGLLESTLFGHVRGAFTGAERARRGLFEAAHGGTLLLDEIGEMSPNMQTRLLRVVQEKAVRRVGSDTPRAVDVRMIAATHRDLRAMVQNGSFREDLYYRLAVVELGLPPLRERSSDIPALVTHFLNLHAPGRAVRVERQALALLTQHPWPGNVRELSNEIQRALLMADAVIEPQHLSDRVRGETEPPQALDLKGQVAQLERRLIREALQKHRGNQTRAAKTLGVSRYGLQKMMKRLQIGNAS